MWSRNTPGVEVHSPAAGLPELKSCLLEQCEQLGKRIERRFWFGSHIRMIVPEMPQRQSRSSLSTGGIAHGDRRPDLVAAAQATRYQLIPGDNEHSRKPRIAALRRSALRPAQKAEGNHLPIAPD